MFLLEVFVSGSVGFAFGSHFSVVGKGGRLIWEVSRRFQWHMVDILWYFWDIIFFNKNPWYRRSWNNLIKWRQPRIRAMSKKYNVWIAQKICYLLIWYLKIWAIIRLANFLLTHSTRMLSIVETKPDPLLPVYCLFSTPRICVPTLPCC